MRLNKARKALWEKRRRAGIVLTFFQDNENKVITLQRMATWKMRVRDCFARINAKKIIDAWLAENRAHRTTSLQLEKQNAPRFRDVANKLHRTLQRDNVIGPNAALERTAEAAAVPSGSGRDAPQDQG
jgi:hypothetical protein